MKSWRKENRFKDIGSMFKLLVWYVTIVLYMSSNLKAIKRLIQQILVNVSIDEDKPFFNICCWNVTRG